MALVINEILVETPPPETSAAQQSRDAQAPAGSAPTPAWTPEFAHQLDQQLRIAFERRQRLLAD